MKTAVRPDRLIRIPDDIFQALGLREGVELDWQVQSGKLLGQPLPPSRELARQIRARARSWQFSSGQLRQVEAEERRREMDNDRREGRL